MTSDLLAELRTGFSRDAVVRAAMHARILLQLQGDPASIIWTMHLEPGYNCGSRVASRDVSASAAGRPSPHVEAKAPIACRLGIGRSSVLSPDSADTSALGGEGESETGAGTEHDRPLSIPKEILQWHRGLLGVVI
jgi:hypothetical protein